MRVIAGRFKGARLLSPKGNWMRPTSDRVRESIFSALGTRLEAAKVLDLFAGTGSFGIEALSRGAARAIFVDVSTRAVDLIAKNASRVGVSPDVYKVSAAKFLHIAARQKLVFDIIYCDPPYRYDRLDALLETIDRCRCLKDGGLVICECAVRSDPPVTDIYQRIWEKVAGDTRILFYSR
jgi:16S rRNA (guanine(966)-N(2))-methyltransferase RsmD